MSKAPKNPDGLKSVDVEALSGIGNGAGTAVCVNIHTDMEYIGFSYRALMENMDKNCGLVVFPAGNIKDITDKLQQWANETGRDMAILLQANAEFNNIAILHHIRKEHIITRHWDVKTPLSLRKGTPIILYASARG